MMEDTVRNNTVTSLYRSVLSILTEATLKTLAILLNYEFDKVVMNRKAGRSRLLSEPFAVFI